MTTESALTTSNVSPAVAESIEVFERLQTVKDILAPDLNERELQLFAMVAQRSGLDPFAKQIYAVKRGGRVTFQTGIDGYRSTAERTGEYDGSDEPEYGPDENGHPAWARVTVYRWRHGRRVGQSATAYWNEFHPGQGQGQMWAKMPRNQLAKCAEALAMRKAFPYVLADIYTSEEMDQAGPADDPGLSAAAALPTAAERIAARRAVAEGKEDDAETPDATNIPSGSESDAQPAPQATAPESDGHPTDTAHDDAVFAAAAALVTGGCQWVLERGQERLMCGIEGEHDAHSWIEEALTKGGKVIRAEVPA